MLGILMNDLRLDNHVDGYEARLAGILRRVQSHLQNDDALIAEVDYLRAVVEVPQPRKPA